MHRRIPFKLAPFRLGLARRAAAAILCFAVPLRAQTAWVKPERFKATPGGMLAVLFTEGPEFGSPLAALDPARIDALHATVGGGNVVLGVAAVVGTTTLVTATFPRPGVAVVAADLKPELRTVARDEVERYLRALRATDDIREEWNDIAAPRAWMERRRVRLKTYVRIGEPLPADRAWTGFTRSGLDMVPRHDPTESVEGRPFGMQVLRDGVPLGGVIVEFLAVAGAREHVVLTDENGWAEAELDAAGEWLVRCTDVRRVPGSDHDWQTDIVAVTTHRL